MVLVALAPAARVKVRGIAAARLGSPEALGPVEALRPEALGPAVRMSTEVLGLVGRVPAEALTPVATQTLAPRALG
jgi:hypothetical protein